MCDQSDYPQSFQACEMPCSAEQYQQYDQQPQQYQQQPQYQQQQQQQQYQQPDESMYSSQIPTETQNPGYYDCNAGYNLAGQDCVDYCDPCYQNGDTMNADVMCEPREDCRPCQDGCQLPMCSPFKKRRYVQPPRRQSFRPSACYQRPTIPMATETIYRKSFENVDPNTAACCRMPPYTPNGYLKTPQGPFEKETITKMSFQPFCGIERVKPIFPQSRSLLGKGPMQGLTTQKHDFVPKFQYKRSKIIPRDNISKSCGSIEKCTIQKLSFMPPCGISRTESFRPRASYQRPNAPMEFETTQKLSYMPVCPSPKEDMPWARKLSYKAPTLPFTTDTVTKLSYQPPGCFLDEECCDPCCDPCCEMPRAAC